MTNETITRQRREGTGAHEYRKETRREQRSAHGSSEQKNQETDGNDRPNEFKVEKTRLQFDLTPSDYQRVIVLLEKCDMKTKATLFDNMVALAEWIVAKLEIGQVIGAINVDQDKYTELQMPFFAKVRRKEPVDAPVSR